MASRRGSLAVAIGTALSAAGLRTSGYEILLHLPREMLAGSLPDDPRKWIEQQLAKQRFELLNTSPSSWFREPYPFGSEQQWTEQQKSTAKEEVVRVLERAVQLVAAARLSPTDIASILNEARKPKPVSSDAVTKLAAECLTVAMEHQWWLRIAAYWWARRQKIWRENRELQSRHRRLLPLVIADLEGPEGLFASPRSTQYRRFEKELGKLDFKEPNSESRWPLGLSDSKWPMGAIRLAKVYRETIDAKAGSSREGPAVGFLVKVLPRAYPDTKKKISNGAIEGVLLEQKKPPQIIRG